jgi:hypothetical protein
MKINVLICLCLMLALTVHSQVNDSRELDFGQYLNSEFSFSRYEPDTLAEAVFLFDVGKSYIEFDTDNGDTFLHFIHRFKIKILSKAGFDWANVEIPLRKSDDKIDELSTVDAVTYTMENGRVRKTKLDKSLIYQEDRSSDFRIMKFAMPDVQVGSVIEVQYEIKSQNMFFFKNWDFQKSIPVIYSEYTAAMVPFYNYSFLLQGRNKFDEQNSGESMNEQTIAGVKFHDMLYTFIMRDLSAFRSEPFITCPEDYLIKLNFQLCEFIRPDGSKTNYLSTWPKFSNTMLSDEFFGKAINNAEAKSKSLLKGKVLPDSALDKAKYVYDWVVSSFNWNGEYDKYSDKNPAQLLKIGTGTTADINLFLVGMLRAAGLEAYPVLLSTRDHGKFKVDSPFDFFFNYVIAAVALKGNYILLDATQPTIGFGNVPSRCINEKGFIPLSKKEFDWVSLNDGKTSMESYNIQLSPMPGADSTDCTVHLQANGHFAMEYREAYQSNKNDMTKGLLSTDLSLTAPYVLTNEQNPSLPFLAEFNARMRQTSTDGSIVVKPFLGFISTGNPLTKPTRQYPIDLIYKQGRRFNITIKIPDGYELGALRSIPSINDENFLLSFGYNLVDKNTMVINASYQFKKEVYDVSEYNNMKNYFRLIDQTFNQSVVLVKKTVL